MMVPLGAGFKIATGRPDMLELGRPMLGGRGSKIGILVVTGGKGDGGGLFLHNKTIKWWRLVLYACIYEYVC